MMTTTTAATMTTKVTRTANIKTAGLRHHEDEPCACWVFGIAGGGHGAGAAYWVAALAAGALGPVSG